MLSYLIIFYFYSIYISTSTRRQSKLQSFLRKLRKKVVRKKKLNIFIIIFSQKCFI
jgi:hypothetical protein